MAKVFWEKDVDSTVLKDKTIAVLGYGSQGKAQALNLRDSGFDLILGLRHGGASWQEAVADGWQPQTVEMSVSKADLIAFLMPDMAQATVFENLVLPNMKQGATLHFAHGFNVHYGSIALPQGSDITLVAPKGPGHLVRRQYLEGKGVPCVFAVAKNASGEAFQKALAFAHGLGGTRAGVLETTFQEETETDLFGEQAVLCGGVTELVKLGFETLVNAGYQPEIAYFECFHELKLIVDLLYEGGFAKMHHFVSDTAKYGDLTRGPRILDESVRENMKQILQEVRNGTFAKEWSEEHEKGQKIYRQLLDLDLNHPIEKVGADLRAQMAWLQEKPATQGAPA